MEIGLDLGTSSVIAVLCRDGRMLGEATHPLTTRSPMPYASEQDPADWWQAVLRVLADLLAPLSASDRQDIAAIGLSGQMHGAVLLDATDQVLRPTMLWNDGRAHAECADLARSLPQIGQIAGVPPLPGFTAPKLLWLSRHAPQDHARIAHVLLPKDYIGLRLHGGHVTDPSDAAGTLWFDQAARRWSDALCAASATDPRWLPELRAGHEVAGPLLPQVAEALGLRPGLPVVTGGGDAATGAVSVGAVEPGAGLISLGTSAQLLVAGDSYTPNPARFVHAFAHTLPDRWVQMAAMLNGARPLAWFAGIAGAQIGPLLAEAEATDPARVPLFLPYLTGERSPHGDPHIRGAFFGLEDSTSRAAMMRAAVEAVAFCFADAFASFDSPAQDPGPLPALGGGARSDFLLQVLADVTGHAVYRPEGAPAGPAIGAARLAALALGRISRTDLARRPVPTQLFTPRDAPALRARLDRWRALYAALRPLSLP
ncbi:xylulokinase [Salipiger marinus]|uniref:xylulokinase n=1 Tax=Salipiger marinus TaxID=555512 RepID=UPI001E3B0A1E|nr:xylulokinase [Salipiger manganoxidans]MCD1618198.1 xylulokinase [Salipiger manganoxidans]MEB3418205.1 xylulokinase [Salipiger manganoxidans]